MGNNSYSNSKKMPEQEVERDLERMAFNDWDDITPLEADSGFDVNEFNVGEHTKFWQWLKNISQNQWLYHWANYTVFIISFMFVPMNIHLWNDWNWFILWPVLCWLLGARSTWHYTNWWKGTNVGRKKRALWWGSAFNSIACLLYVFSCHLHHGINEHGLNETKHHFSGGIALLLTVVYYLQGTAYML